MLIKCIVTIGTNIASMENMDIFALFVINLKDFLQIKRKEKNEPIQKYQTGKSY